MKTKAKYVILFPALMFATMCFGGNHSIDDIAPKKYSFYMQASTTVFATKSIQIDEAGIKSEKVNGLTETVQNFIKIRLKKAKRR